MASLREYVAEMSFSWDRTSVIFKVGVSIAFFSSTDAVRGRSSQETFTSHRILAHPQGFVGQVAWYAISHHVAMGSAHVDVARSPSGHLLLTKLNRGVKVWTEVCCDCLVHSPSNR